MVLKDEQRPDVSATFRKVNPESPRAVTSPPQIIDSNKNAGVESKPPRSSAALENAKRIKLSTVKFGSLPLAIVITMLRDESIKHDSVRKDITISLASDAKQLAGEQINLDLVDVTLEEALGRVADSVGLEIQAADAELFLVRKKTKK